MSEKDFWTIAFLIYLWQGTKTNLAAAWADEALAEWRLRK